MILHFLALFQFLGGASGDDMARVDYYLIEQAIQTVLQNDADLSSLNIPVLIEASVDFHEGPVIVIYAKRRAAPQSAQSLSAGTRTKFFVSFEVWAFGVSFDRQTVHRDRDDLIGKVEIALMRKRDLNVPNLVSASWLEGGEFDSGEVDENSFFSGASADLIVDTTAVT